MRSKKKEVPLTGAFGVLCVLVLGQLVLEYRHYKTLEELKQINDGVVFCDTRGVPYGSQGTRMIYNGVLGWWEEVPPSQGSCPVGGDGDLTAVPSGHVPLPDPETTASKAVAFHVPKGSTLKLSGRHLMVDNLFGLTAIPDPSVALTRLSEICKDGAWTPLDQGEFKSETFFPAEVTGEYFRIPGRGLLRVINIGQRLDTPEYNFSQKALDRGFKQHAGGWLYDGDAGVCAENAIRVSHWWHEIELPFTVLARHDGGGVLSQIEYSGGSIFKVRKGLLSTSRMLQDTFPLGRVSLILRGACTASACITLAIAGLPSVTAIGVAVLTASITTSLTDYLLWGVFHAPTTLVLVIPSAAMVLLDTVLTRYLFRARPKSKQTSQKVPQRQPPQQGPRFKQKVN
eukprot:TRINITY_DN33662_c0_g1_i1.p1 TRINITY_DN33662_c0_g1~~TRINITY_DN33662_c0_g1_i1.p1  ORF type:complete len:415 (+),score=68.30 TRINITY_DN33662_c0_g1_i1:50-1246(+)